MSYRIPRCCPPGTQRPTPARHPGLTALNAAVSITAVNSPDVDDCSQLHSSDAKDQPRLKEGKSQVNMTYCDRCVAVIKFHLSDQRVDPLV